ncbi:hypothetical protein FOMPIDRAFT_1056732 [Fomitopsis schrenkii]|uniref:Uncharacterized protein n=1 Tax=Fomitopsis schrenkii TaxID=2126942 RepID=S8ES10_FOMSC|nr:hypothetical protein FOMPIDRAFT_1056732 [Fomitopsis schrenkii]
MIEPTNPVVFKVKTSSYPAYPLERDEDVFRPGDYVLRDRHLSVRSSVGSAVRPPKSNLTASVQGGGHQAIPRASGAPKPVHDKKRGDEDKTGGDRPLLQRVVGSQGLRIEVDESSAHWFTATSRQAAILTARRMPASDALPSTDDIESAIPAFKERLSLRDPSISPPEPEQPRNPGMSVLNPSLSTVTRAGPPEAPAKTVDTGIDTPNSPPNPSQLESEKLPLRTVV